ncbi:MAG: 3-phenylpropionate/trans-cinnamate dioxygenase ferredoxin reductase component [Gaiellales bacterium]|nr:3-phenylpropionate/trans-cinnamate dioxygenase ferredoxin reductase component [Gaiellales bacterium]
MRKPAGTHFDVIVVGGGVAAGACVSTLREAGYDGTIAVTCAEPHPPYTRPGLTKQVLRGEKPADAALWRSRQWYREQSISLLSDSMVQSIDPAGHRLEVSGRKLTYGSLVLATGAEPRHLDFGAAVADRVHVLRSFADADAIRPHLGEGTRWLVVGGGFIGAEFAASAALTGSSVSLVMREEVIFEQAFGASVGAWFDSRLRRRGVDVCAAAGVASLERCEDGLRVGLDSGRTLTVDRILVGAGVIPSTGLASAAGLTLELGGIAVDGHLRTSENDIYAIGDVAAYESELHRRRVRIEHWDIARAHGAHVANELIDPAARAFRVLPYFFGTLGDWAFLEYTGVGGGRAVMRGSADGDDMSAAYIADDGVLTGLITVGRPEDLAAAAELVVERARLAPHLLADDRVPLAACRLKQPLVTG